MQTYIISKFIVGCIIHGPSRFKQRNIPLETYMYYHNNNFLRHCIIINRGSQYIYRCWNACCWNRNKRGFIFHLSNCCCCWCCYCCCCPATVPPAPASMLLLLPQLPSLLSLAALPQLSVTAVSLAGMLLVLHSAIIAADFVSVRLLMLLFCLDDSFVRVSVVCEVTVLSVRLCHRCLWPFERLSTLLHSSSETSSLKVQWRVTELSDIVTNVHIETGMILLVAATLAFSAMFVAEGAVVVETTPEMLNNSAFADYKTNSETLFRPEALAPPRVFRRAAPPPPTPPVSPASSSARNISDSLLNQTIIRSELSEDISVFFSDNKELIVHFMIAGGSVVVAILFCLVVNCIRWDHEIEI